MSMVTHPPLAGFERRLLDALTEIDAERRPVASTTTTTAHATAAGSRRLVPGRPRWALPALLGTAAGLLAVAVVLTVPAATTAPGSHRTGPAAGTAGPGVVAAVPAAFTLVRNSDGSVTFAAHDLVDTAAATRALNDAGIAGRVVNAGRDACTAPAGTTNTGSLGVLRGATGTVTIVSSSYPAGGGVLLVVDPHVVDPGTGTVLPVGLLVFVFAHADAIPTCYAQGTGR